MQRVSRASVSVEGSVRGEIGAGLLVFLGIQKMDTEEERDWLVNRIVRLRVFEDEEGRMNRSLLDVDGELLLISQFTLLGNVRKGTRPSYNRAADPEEAVPLYESVHSCFEQMLGKRVPTGVFGTHMDISALNDGPVTLIIDSRTKDF